MFGSQNNIVKILGKSGTEDLQNKVAIKINEAWVRMWNSTAMFGARSSLSAAGLDNAPVIEQIKYLFDRCPNKEGFEHMETVPLVYFRYCLENQLLPPEDEWLNDIIEQIRNKHGNNLVLKMLNVLLFASSHSL